MSDEEIVKLITQIANNFGISCDDASYIIKSFENFGKEQVMLNIEDDVKVLKNIEKLRSIEFKHCVTDREIIAIKNILSEREQDKARIKELEEENASKQKAYDDCYCEYKHYKQFDSIPKQKVIDIAKQIQEEYNKVQEQFDCIWNKKSKDNYERYKLQELSAVQQELGFILGKFEKLLEEGE